MFDLELRLANRPGDLATFGDAIPEAGVSIEGSGVFTAGGEARAHFLFEDGEAARRNRRGSKGPAPSAPSTAASLRTSRANSA